MTKPASVACRQRHRSRPNSKPHAHAQQIAQTLASIDQLHAKSPQGARLLSLLKTWLGDDSGYDEETWPVLKKSLNRERARVGARRLLDE
jgi:hypothetical protein